MASCEETCPNHNARNEGMERTAAMALRAGNAGGVLFIQTSNYNQTAALNNGSIIAYNNPMTATAHALVAGAIATKFTDPQTAAGLAFVSHFVMDSIPHWDIGTNWRERPRSKTGAFAIAETTLGIVVTIAVFSSRAPMPTLLAAIIFALLPDWLEVPYYILFARQNKKQPAKTAGFWETLTYRVYKTENFFHAKAESPLLGMLTQIVTVCFFFLLLAR